MTVTANWQAPRAALLWLMVAQLAILAGLVPVLPLWVLAVVGLVAIWRLQIYRGAWSYPGRWLKLTLVLASATAMMVSFGRLAGLEPFASLLVIAFALKLLEMHRRRDGVVLIFVGYFCASLMLVFEQSIANALYVFCCLVLVTAALNGMHQRQGSLWWPLRRGSVLLLQSMPLMLVLFVVMPRLGTLWAVPSQQGAATTGVSGEMSPGDFTQLGKNGAVAFRVSFDDAAPPLDALYWRGPVLTDFDGRRWRQSEPWAYGDGGHVVWPGQRARWQQKISPQGPLHGYEIVLEPTHQPWLFGLATPVAVSEGVGLTRELRLVNRQPVANKRQYRVTSSLSYHAFAGELLSAQRRQTLRLPKGYNPRARARAHAWRQQSDSERDYIDKVLTWFHREFTYTLEPPALGKHSVDEFLWQTQRGFCEHYAASFVVLMRAAGIPARVVTGYQGAERHPDGYLLVHQYNAHAWAEVWLAGEGWRRIDPTAAVAPERIELGFEQYFSTAEGYLGETPFSLSRFRHIGWLNQLRLQLDALNYYWATWVLRYEDKQQSLLRRLLGDLNPTRLAWFVLLLGGGTIAVLGSWMLRDSWRRPAAGGVDRAFQRLCRKLQRAGIERSPGEGARDYGRRLQRSDYPRTAEAIRLLQLYEQIQFAGDRQLQAAFVRGVRRL